MVTSSFMPNVVVEIAFNAGFSTPAASRTWIDVSDYVELRDRLSIAFGRQDERSVAASNKLTLTLDNSDGRFTPGRAASPYYPNVKLDRPIRVTATPVGGTPSVRFLGFISEWPVSWDQGTSGYSSVKISANSRLAGLGLTAGLRSIVEEEILLDGPVAYYPLSEPQGATEAADISGFGSASLATTGAGAPIVFGNATGPGTDDLTAAEFSAGQYMSAPGFGTVGTIEFFASWTGTAEPSFSFGNIGSDVAVTLGAGVSVTLPPLTYSAALNDGTTHHIAITGDGATARLYVDGTLRATTAWIFTLGPAASSIYLGAVLSDTGAITSGNVTVAHLALYPTAVSDARIADHAASGLGGFAGDRTDTRLRRYAKYAALEASTLDLALGSTTVAHIATSGKQVIELLRLLEATESGVLFDDRDGDLVLHNRAHRFLASPAFTLDMAEQQVESDFAPKLDRSALLNDVTASNGDGTVPARYVDQSSRAEYRPATDSITTASDDPREPLQLAAWLVNAYSTPRVRIPSLSVQALAQVGKTPSIQTLMTATVGTMLTLANQPSQSDNTTANYFVEGVTEVYGLESMVMTFNVSPSAPSDQVLIWDDATRGVWDSRTWAY